MESSSSSYQIQSVYYNDSLQVMAFRVDLLSAQNRVNGKLSTKGAEVAKCDDCSLMECSECALRYTPVRIEGLEELNCNCKGIHSGYKMVGMVLRTKEDDDQEACIPPRIWRTHSGRRKFIKGTVLKSSRPPPPSAQ